MSLNGARGRVLNACQIWRRNHIEAKNHRDLIVYEQSKQQLLEAIADYERELGLNPWRGGEVEVRDFDNLKATLHEAIGRINKVREYFTRPTSEWLMNKAHVNGRMDEGDSGGNGFPVDDDDHAGDGDSR